MSDAVYYAKNKRITGSTKAISSFLALVSEGNPGKTINELKSLLMDKTEYIYSPEAIAVLDAHIKAGYGDLIPDWN